MNIRKFEELEKKIYVLSNIISDLRDKNLKYKQELENKNLSLKLNEKERLNIKKKLLDYENMKKQYFEIKNRIELIYKKLEILEINL